MPNRGVFEEAIEEQVQQIRQHQRDAEMRLFGGMVHDMAANVPPRRVGEDVPPPQPQPFRASPDRLAGFVPAERVAVDVAEEPEFIPPQEEMVAPKRNLRLHDSVDHYEELQRRLAYYESTTYRLRNANRDLRKQLRSVKAQLKKAHTALESAV